MTESPEERAKQDVHSELQKHYGDAGVYAAEGSCLLAEDYMKGYDHCLGLILPALEEETFAQNGNLG
jgi:hypothetical protein